ncbi:hypothetical protein EDB83DRAFT_2320309 [Lactarius deliciosus]|nr:hypothetical protein EDB83DRAFT_2320309 [Lactarius deliciosus]
MVRASTPHRCRESVALHQYRAGGEQRRCCVAWRCTGVVWALLRVGVVRAWHQRALHHIDVVGSRRRVGVVGVRRCRGGAARWCCGAAARRQYRGLVAPSEKVQETRKGKNKTIVLLPAFESGPATCMPSGTGFPFPDQWAGLPDAQKVNFLHAPCLRADKKTCIRGGRVLGVWRDKSRREREAMPALVPAPRVNAVFNILHRLRRLARLFAHTPHTIRMFLDYLRSIARLAWDWVHRVAIEPVGGWMRRRALRAEVAISAHIRLFSGEDEVADLAVRLALPRGTAAVQGEGTEHV